MSRRLVLVLALAFLGLLALAIAPWTMSGGSLAAVVSRHLDSQSGLSLEVRGRSIFALLPVPRVKFEDVRLSGNGVLAEGGTLRGELRILPLMGGRVELSEVTLDETRVTLPLDPTKGLDGSLAVPLQARLGQPLPLRRLVVTRTDVAWPGGGIDDVNLVVTLPGGDLLEAAGTLSWRGEPLEISRTAISPGLFAAGQPSPFSLNLAAPGTRVALTGEVQAGAEPRITGEGSIELRSTRDFTRWSGIELPLAPSLRRASIAGEFSANRRFATWPSVVLTIGQDRLEGGLSVRYDGRRPIVTGTLDSSRIDLSEFFTPLLQARTSAGLWSNEDASLAAFTGADLDLRLSAADAAVGRIRLSDMALSVLVRPGRIEASLGRAGLNKGGIKGRLILSEATETTELKLQGTFEQIDLAAFLSDTGQPRWILGEAQGSVALETSGITIVDLVRQAHGRAAIMVKQGELVGIGLVDALKRVEKRPLAASTEWKGGRTFFDRASVALNVGAGVGEITDGSLSAPNLQTSLRGRVSLIERSVAVRALVDPAAPSPLPSPLIVLDVVGGWDDVAIIPDAKSLIERSGAAKPLLGGRVVPRPPPLATAQ